VAAKRVFGLNELNIGRPPVLRPVAPFSAHRWGNMYR
jgi:hypothetical protein